MSYPENDSQYTETTVTAVGDGSITMATGWSIGFPADFEPRPKPGDTIRQYGRGTGYSVRGLFLNGERVWYRTEEEQEFNEREQADAFEREVAARAEAIRESGVATEAEMREAEVPWPGTIEELADYIRALVDRPHDYGTSAYAMSLAAVAAFQYIAKALGTTGFQASCADLDILRRTRGLKGPFILLKAEDLLYPQYDLRARLEEFITESLPWAGEQARKLLNERVEAHANAVAHWRRLATEPAK